jgi:hypothetical protein
MKKTRLYWPLAILGIIQIGTAIFFMLPDSIVEAIGFKTVKLELLVYLYVICSLYFSLGVLYLMGALMPEIRFTALIIACIDIPLEVLSYFAGFPHMSLSYLLIFFFSIIITIPCVFCYSHLIKNYCLAKFKWH